MSGAKKAGDDPVARWLDAYFHGRWLPLPPLAAARSPFQQRLRAFLWRIPPGATCTYGQLATRMNSAPRAVGQALRANPLPVLVPCHRVVAADGLGGFAAPGHWKRALLAWERRFR
ncbi:MAG: methylated-DNA--[protein]-cysteine S-methyltransferase [Zetaproteobacteria bacterium]|nr:MAG: methylated-DNA--[protein]-cysteine S-methyltransferase [Zetaproteobacteria bacterium]